jgi:hypothetical protein
VVELKYPRYPDKDAFPSGNEKMKADEVMSVDLSDEDTDNEDVVPLGEENTTLDPDAQESSNDKDDEGNLGGQSIPLVGSWLGVVSVGKEENEELARLRIQATPRKLFDSSSQPSPSDLRRESRPSLSSLSLPPNSSRTWRNKCLAESDERRRQRALDDPDTPMIAS